MGEHNVPIIPDVVKSASEAIHANIPETAKQTDGALSTVVGFFNNVVLFPVKKANLTFKYKLEAFESDLREKIKDVPDENLQVPPTMIAGPVLEALRYTYDEEELRELYENLLASAMDNRKASHVHPAFVGTIQQMSPLDAVIMSRVADFRQLRCAKIIFGLKGTGRVYAYGMPNYFTVELLECGNAFDISASIINLKRLGLIDITDNGFNNLDYEELKNHPYVKKRERKFKRPGEELEIQFNKRGIDITNFGGNFVEICLGRQDYHAG